MFRSLLYAGIVGVLFCDSDSLMIQIIHQDRLEKILQKIKGLKNTELEDRQCPQCVYGYKCPAIITQ